MPPRTKIPDLIRDTLSDLGEDVDTGLIAVENFVWDSGTSKWIPQVQLGTVPVTGPLTDAELRAAAVNVETELVQPLTDAQLRASAVLVSANQGGAWTVTANAGTGTLLTRQKSDTSARSTVAASTVSSTLVPANSSRKGLTIFNDSNTTLLIALAAVTVSAVNFDLKVLTDTLFTLPFGWTGAVSGLWIGVPVGFARCNEFT